MDKLQTNRRAGLKFILVLFCIHVHVHNLQCSTSQSGGRVPRAVQDSDEEEEESASVVLQVS